MTSPTSSPATTQTLYQVTADDNEDLLTEPAEDQELCDKMDNVMNEIKDLEKAKGLPEKLAKVQNNYREEDPQGVERKNCKYHGRSKE